MKKTIIMAMLVLMSTAAQAQKELFEKYEGTKDVTTVILSKAMLSLADKFASIGDSDVGGLAGRLDGIRILKCEKKALVPEIKSAAQAAYRRDKFEEIMSANDGGKLTVIYQRTLKNGKSEYALLQTSEIHLVIFNVTGDITLEEMQQFIK